MVSEGAVLGPGCVVGPGAIISAGTRLGARCRVEARAILTGEVLAGDDNRFGPGVVIGGEPQDFAFDPAISSRVEIGNSNTLREYVTIHRGTKEDTATSMGDDNYLMVGAHLGHNTHIGNHVVIANNCLLAGYVEVGDRVVLGGGTVFHQFMRIGRLAMVRGGTRFGQDIPPFAMGDEDNILAGLNIIGLRRNGFSAEVRAELQRAYRLVLLGGLNISQGLAEADKTEWGAEAREFLEFIRASKRGICRSHRRKGERGAA